MTSLGLAFAAAVVSGAAALVYEVVWLRTLAREPGEPQALFFAGVASWWLGRKDDAQRYLERATALEPQNVEFRGALARLRGGTLSR